MARTPNLSGAPLVVLALALTQMGCGESGDVSDERGSGSISPAPGLTTYRDDARGYEVTFPSAWHRARENLTRRRLIDPREILTIATFPLRLRPGESCYPPFGAPVPSIDRLGPRDALISVQERIKIEEEVADNRPHGFSLRPLELHYGPGASECARRRLGRVSFDGFADQGRQFYAFVALGRAASPRTRNAVKRVLDSLVFEAGRKPVAGDGVRPQQRVAPKRRLELIRTPYVGVSCPRPNRFSCDRLGLTVWLRQRPEQVVATIGGKKVSLSFRDHPPARERPYEGFLRPAGLVDGPLRITPKPGTRRWEGNPPVYATLRIEATFPHGVIATKTVRVRLRPGYS